MISHPSDNALVEVYREQIEKWSMMLTIYKFLIAFPSLC
jgi:hypothetical protein